MAQAKDDVAVAIGGRIFGGWTAIEGITRGIDALAGTFSISLTERWPGHPEDWGIEAGDACEVFIGDDRVLTGWIDQAAYSIDPERHPVTVSGIEKTGDLTDCSALHTPASWKNRRLEQIASDLAAPFGIKVTAVASTGAPFAKFALQQGETVFAAINRMCRQRGVLPVTTPAGDVELIVPGKTPAGYRLVLGENIEAISFTNSMGERFSDYVLKGYSADGLSRPKASATDGGVGRYRPLLIVSDDESTPGSLATRAKHEATIRAGRGQQVPVTVSGWRSASGQLYVPDRLVPVSAKQVGIDGELLISSVTYTLGEMGRRTVLTTGPKEAFSLEPIPAPAKRRRRSTPPPGGKG